MHNMVYIQDDAFDTECIRQPQRNIMMLLFYFSPVAMSWLMCGDGIIHAFSLLSMALPGIAINSTHQTKR